MFSKALMSWRRKEVSKRIESVTKSGDRGVCTMENYIVIAIV